MLRAGVEIHEISPASLASPSARLGRFGRSIGRLHAKVAVIDRRLMFIGSMKARANTEVGLVIEAQRWSNKPRPRCFIASSTPRRTSCGSPRTGPTSSGSRPGPMAPASFTPASRTTPGAAPETLVALAFRRRGLAVTRLVGFDQTSPTRRQANHPRPVSGSEAIPTEHEARHLAAFEIAVRSPPTRTRIKFSRAFATPSAF